MFKKALKVVLKTVLPLGFGIALVVYLFTSMEPEVKKAFYKALSEANYGWIILSIALSVLALFSRAYRWNYMLAPLGFKTSLWNRYHSMMIGYLMNLTIPRAGEAMRSAMLYRSEGVPFSKSFGTIVAERVFDVVMLMSVTALAAFFSADDFWKLKTMIQNSFGSEEQRASASFWFYVVFALLVVFGIAVLVVFPVVRKKIFGFVTGIVQGVFAVFKTKNPLAFLGHTLFIWVMYVTYFSICFFALDETSHVPFSGMLLAFVAGSVGISLTNGGLGVFPLVVGMVIEYFLIDTLGSAEAKGIGWALAMIIWSSQTILIIALGLLSFVLLPKNFVQDGVSRSVE